MNKLVLFDIDRTLIGRSECHHAAFSYAFKKVYNVDVGIKIINYAGMTDPCIVIEVLKKIGLNESLIKAKIEECLDVIVDYFRKNVSRDNIPILDGVEELLRELNKHDVIMGIVTGNLDPIARGKLKKIGLNHYFKVGGFGSDNINRTELVKIVINLANDYYNFNDDDVFVIGDTPRDIKAGLEAGVKTIGVATGRYLKEELEDSGADFVFENLKDKNGILKIIND
jgi:phosphoglycolate phosphatase